MVENRDSLKQRLKAARDRQGLDRPQAGQGGGPTSPWGFGLRAGVEVFSALVVGVGLGFALDRWLGTWPWLFLVFFVLGAAAGVLNVYRLFNPRSGARKD
ncbi:AtpZ/AtpI family protein [Sediminicoccus sp. BL-A-41-H5]|uniref:AtpZ/AtpI family protein n=1 Tax=Sediminicoccus sp. BL-A-41-H5 TaxID=3421106 RepID=UPI003D667A9E